MNIGDKIKKIRTDKKLTQKELATTAHISEISIRKYENGERFPKYETIQSIAEALGTSASYIMSISNSFSIELLATIQRDYSEKDNDGIINNTTFLEIISDELDINKDTLFDVFNDPTKDLPIYVQKKLLKLLKKINSNTFYQFIKDFNLDMSPEIKLFVESIMINTYKNLECSSFIAFKNYLTTTFGNDIKDLKDDDLMAIQEEVDKFLEFALFKLQKISCEENIEDEI